MAGLPTYMMDVGKVRVQVVEGVRTCESRAVAAEGALASTLGEMGSNLVCIYLVHVIARGITPVVLTLDILVTQKCIFQDCPAQRLPRRDGCRCRSHEAFPFMSSHLRPAWASP